MTGRGGGEQQVANSAINKVGNDRDRASDKKTEKKEIAIVSRKLLPIGVKKREGVCERGLGKIAARLSSRGEDY